MSYELGYCPVKRHVVRRTSIRNVGNVGRGVAAPVSIPAVATTLGDLDFSLKPPKWLRKAQPGKILKKLAVPIAIGASLLIPGVAPAVATVGRGIFGGAKAVGGAALSIFRPKSKPIGLPTGALAAAAGIPASMPSPRGTLANLFGGVRDLAGTISTPAAPGSPITISVSNDEPVSMSPSQNEPQPSPSTVYTSGGGGGGGSGTSYAPSSEVESGAAGGLFGNIPPVVLAGGALLAGFVLMSMVNGNRSRKAA